MIAIESMSREKSRNLHSFRDFILEFFWSDFQALSKERKKQLVQKYSKFDSNQTHLMTEPKNKCRTAKKSQKIRPMQSKLELRSSTSWRKAADEKKGKPSATTAKTSLEEFQVNRLSEIK